MMSVHIGQEWRNKTLKELFIQWQYHMLESWNHTTTIQSCFAGKNTSFSSLHPYMATKGLGSQRIKVEPRPIMQIETHRNGQRVSILKEMCGYGSSKETQ